MNKKLKKLIIVSLSTALLSTYGCGTKEKPAENVDKSGKQNTQQNNKASAKKANEQVSEDFTDKSAKLNENIRINQIGYRTADKKLVVVSGTTSDFQIVNEDTNKTVLKGTLSNSKFSIPSSENVVYGDFSEIKQPGKYFVYVSGVGKSYSFTINDSAYSEVKDAFLKGFYFQRCGAELEEKYADKWNHGVCHTSQASLYEDPAVKMDVSGGWHDAGDYGRYVVPAGTAVAQLLLSYEFFPNAFKSDINIPESGNNLPDILDEAKYEIDWLFKMQDADTGAVYNKVATQWFPGMIMPEKDDSPLIIYQVSSPATADFAATLALASRIYQSFDKAFSEKCLAASEKAWKWLTGNPNPTLFKNPSDAGSGEYGDGSDVDERFWAAAELYKTTGKDEYHNSFKDSFAKLNNLTSLGWGDMSGFGSIAYLFTDKAKVDAATYDKIKDKFLYTADGLMLASQDDAYKVTLKFNQYGWGSNMGVLNNAIQLIIADKLNPNQAYIDAAINQWNYILGFNSLNQSFVTGYGSKPVMNPHHRPSEDDGVVDPVPGLVAGGPNSGLQDDTAKKDLDGQPAAKCYTDKMGSYSTNEIAIYWNSPAVFVAGYLNN